MLLLVLQLLIGLAAECADKQCKECPDNTDQCARCNSGFGPDFRGQCVACKDGRSGENCEDLNCGGTVIKHCKSCSGRYCEQCLPNYQRNSGWTQCLPCGNGGIGMRCMDRVCGSKVLRNCKECAEEGKSQCARCHDDFYLTASGCRPCQGNHSGENCTVLRCQFGPLAPIYYNYCAKCNGKAIESCIECLPGYYLGGVPTSPCHPCQDPYTGVECVDFMCRSGEKETRLPYCTECNKDTLKCTVCRSGYYLRDDNKCVSCPNGRTGINCKSITCYGAVRDYCTKCSNTALSTSCIECQSNYRVDNGVCVPCPAGRVGHECMTLMCGGVPRDHCKACSAEVPGKCEACSDGYYADSGSCFACPATCRTCSGRYSCQSCLDGHSGQMCEDATCYNRLLRGCIRCSGAGYALCETCADGYSLSHRVCVKDPECYVPNCVRCLASDPGVCEACAAGHYLKGGRCPPCASIPGCRACSPAGQCTACAEGAIASGEGDSLRCLLCSGFAADCARCTEEGECLGCAGGSVLVGGICVPCPENCRRCFREGFCHECVDRHYRTAEGGCSPCQENCLKCSTPETCGVCAPGYRMADLRCYPCPSHCKSCSAENRCTECLPGSFMENSLTGVCGPCLDNCLLCNNATACERCVRGYSTYRGPGTCERCAANCDVCKGEKDTDCVQPAGGHYLDPLTSTVLPCMPHCAFCEDGQSCSEPRRGYYYSRKTNFVTACPEGCTRCAVLERPGSAAQDSVQCTACSDGYALAPAAGVVSACVREPQRRAVPLAASSSLIAVIVVLSLVILWIIAVLLLRCKESTRPRAASRRSKIGII